MIDSTVFIRKNGENPETLKGWGKEILLVNTDKFCAKILKYNFAGSMSSKHFHKEKEELFFVKQGKFEFSYFDELGNERKTILEEGDSVYIPQCQSHQLKALTDDAEIWESSTNHSDFDVYRIGKGDSQTAGENSDVPF